MPNPHTLSRRRFLQTTTAGLALTAIRPHAFAANGKLSHACIGVGGMGATDLKNFLSHPEVQIVAICDVDQTRLEATGTLVPEARRYSDWRELLRAEGKRIDSVNI